MEIIINIFPIFYTGIYLLMFYSVIRWIAVFIADRKDIKRRKKYALIYLGCMGIMVLVAIYPVR